MMTVGLTTRNTCNVSDLKLQASSFKGGAMARGGGGGEYSTNLDSTLPDDHKSDLPLRVKE